MFDSFVKNRLPVVYQGILSIVLTLIFFDSIAASTGHAGASMPSVVRDSSSEVGRASWKDVDENGQSVVNVSKLFTSKDGSYQLIDQFRKYFYPKKKLVVFDKCTEVFYGGTVKVDYYLARHAQTLSKSFTDDSHDQFRERSELSFKITHKMDQYRTRPVVEGQITLGNVMFWRTLYKPTISAMMDASRSTNYDLIFPPVVANMQEAWLQLNIDQLISNNEPFGLSFKAGFFPYLVGRGISLGDWYNGGPSILGFSKTDVQMRAPKFAPGVLLKGTVYQNVLDYEFYYSPAVSEEQVPPSLTNGYVLSTERDSLSDRHIISGRLLLTSDFYDKSKTLLEPYFVYYNSPRHSTQTSLDSSLRFITFGFMLDHKAGGFEVNVEVARQFGRHKMKEYLNTSRPDQKKFMSADGTLFLVDANNNPINDDGSAKSPRANLLRPYFDSTTAGANVVDKSGTAASSTTSGPYYYTLPQTYEEWLSEASSLPQSQRYFERHPSYELDLAGRMAVIDMRYTFDDVAVQIAGSAGYFSGDSYPFNDDVSKLFAGDKSISVGASQPLRTSKNFIPLRDYHYTGLWALPMIMFNSGVVPRSYDYSIQDGVAYNEQNAATNLMYLAAGITFGPTNDLEKFKICANVCTSWAASDVYAWDLNAQLPTNLAKEQAMLSFSSNIPEKPQEQLKSTDKGIQPMVGYVSGKLASNYLGWEINFLANYWFTDNIDLMVKAGFFFPGQRYKDLQGQPNALTSRTSTMVLANGTSFTSDVNKGLGSDMAYGLNIRLGYEF